MAFSFGGAASTPAFGAASSGGFSFGGASSPAFGASLTPVTGATSAPSFAFATASAFGASPPLFGAASSTSFFGASSTPSLFGAPSPAATPSLFGGSPQQQQQQQSTGTALITKDGRPVTHSTKWEDLSPQAQQYLQELEKIVVQYREECSKLDADRELASEPEGEEEIALIVRQSLTSLTVAVKQDTESTESFREVVLHLLRHTDSALHSFKRNYTWREASKQAMGGQIPAGVLDPLGRPGELPSSFLSEAVSSYAERLHQQKAAVSDLEQALDLVNKAYGTGGGSAKQGSDCMSASKSLEVAIANVYDCILHSAARIQALDDKVAEQRESYLIWARQQGDQQDPFEEAAAQEKLNKVGRGKQSRHVVKGQTTAELLALPPSEGPTGLFGTMTAPTIGSPAAARTRRGRR